MAEPVAGASRDASRPDPAAAPTGPALLLRLIAAFTFARFRNV